ncbi:MAG: Yip1 family protein [Verrucomicrobiota bacterium]
MIKALLLIFKPVWAWERVFRAQRSFAFVLLLYLTPMVLITVAVEGYGLVHWGRWQKDVTYLKKITPGEAVIYEFAHALLTFGLVFLGAKIIKSLGETFHGRHTYTQAFTTVAYGLSPLFLLRLFDAFPSIGPWTTWGIGIVLCMSVLYQGVPRVMMPDPPHAFGLYLMSALLLVIITGLARFVTAWYLQGYFKPVEEVISRLGAQLPF